MSSWVLRNCRPYVGVDLWTSDAEGCRHPYRGIEVLKRSRSRVWWVEGEDTPVAATAIQHTRFRAGRAYRFWAQL
jgi:hypothetical protein